MATKYLDSTGLSTVWGKIKALIPQPASTSSENPVMDGTAAIGSSNNYARADHVHPSDTSKVSTSTSVNGHPLSSDVTVTANDIGAITGVQKNGTDLTITNGKVNITDFTGATSGPDNAGTAGLVPAPSSGSTGLYLKSNGSWASISYPKLYLKKASMGTDKIEVSLSTSGGSHWDIPVFIGAGTGDVGVQGIVPAPPQKTSGSDIRYLSNGGSWASLPVTAASGNTLTYGGTTHTFAPLDNNNKIDAQYLPSYVDDVVEAYPVSGASALSSGWLSTTSGGSALTPESGKIYILMAASGDYAVNSQFRWSGSTYVELSNGGVSAITDAEINAICV